MFKKYLLFLSTMLVVWTLTGCFESPTKTQKQKEGKLFVVESDYQSGVMERLNTNDTTMGSDNLSIHKDAVIRAYNGYVYIVERFGSDNIIKFDPSKNGKSGVLHQTHFGDNWNLQDIEFVSDIKAYVTSDRSQITIFNPEEGTVIDSIDISAYTYKPDKNASPYATQMAIADDKLYVMLQRRDGWNPGASTLILTIDVSTDKILESDTIACKYKNGYDMVYSDGALYVTNPGSMSSTTTDGGVEKIDLATKKVSTVIDEKTLGGNPNQIIHKEGDLFYIQNYKGWKKVSVVEIDASSGSITKTLPNIKDAFGGICYDKVDEKLYVGERDSIDVGIKVFEDNKLVAGPIKSDNTLPPVGLVILH